MTAEEYQTEAERITPQLRQTALRYMGDASLSEDIAQDVLLRLWQLLDELRPPMDGLALTMVRNECLMRLRKQPRTVGMEGHDMAEQPSVNPMAELTLSMLDKLTLYRSQNYCEAIVYGEPVNDRELIMREVSGTMSQINKQSTVEHQLRDVLMTSE